MIEKLSALNISIIEIFTNGHLIDEYYVRLFKKHKIQVAISIYSENANEHDLITIHKGSWTKTVNAIRLLKEANIEMRFGTVATIYNKNSVKNVNKWLKNKFDIEQTETSFDVVRNCGRGNNKDIIPWDLFQEKHIRAKPDFFPVNIELLQKTMFGNICWNESACLMPNGDITPCEMESEIVIGNILKDNITNILQSNKNDFAQYLSKDKIAICKDCEYRYVCWECRAMTHKMDNTKFNKPITCTYNPYKGIWGEVDNALKDRILNPNS